MGEHLTEGPADRVASKTHVGMAHFAGTGPAGCYCRGCEFYAGLSLKNHSLVEKEGWCEKYKALVLHQGPTMKVSGHGKRFPADTAACRFYEHRKPKDEPRSAAQAAAAAIKPPKRKVLPPTPGPPF